MLVYLVVTDALSSFVCFMVLTPSNGYQERQCISGSSGY